MMLPQSDAILRLLDDDEPMTVALMKRKLQEIAGVPALRSLRERAGGRAGKHLDDLIAELTRGQVDREFAAYCREFGEHGDLEEASWRFAATMRPHEDFAPQRAALDAWGAVLEGRLADAVTPY